MKSPPRDRAVSFGLGLLFLVSFFNYMDRYMLAVLLPGIKADLDLSDTQIGLITGIAFTLFYATLGVPIARLADKYSRRVIISVALAAWSVMTALCGLAQNFWQLAIARVLVGVGEAGASPPSHSLISDYYPPERRARALSVFTIGAPVGIMVGFVLGGWLAENYSWRIALVTVAVPGLLLAFVTLAKLYEPPRGSAPQGSDGVATSAAEIPFLTVCSRLARSRAFVHLCIGNGLYASVWLGVVQWMPSYYTRSFDLTITQVGFFLAIVLGLSQLIGMLASGFATDIAAKRNVRWYALVPALGVGISTPPFLLVFLTDNYLLSMAGAFVAFMLGVMQGPASFAAVQTLAPPAMRAVAAAVILLITNLIGGFIGTPSAGILSDYLQPQYGEESLRYALLIVAIFFGVWSTLHYYLASRALPRELAAEP